LSETGASADVAVGKKVALYGGANTANSRVFIPITSTLSGSFMDQLWIGMMPYNGADFQHIWYFDHADPLGTGASETTQAGSYGTNIVEVVYAATPGMLRRASFNVFGQYNALGVFASADQAAGRYVVLIRYMCAAGTGTVTGRVGVAGSVTATPAYNEPRLLDTDGNWHFMEAGLIKFPPQGQRQEQATVGRVSACYLYLDMQYVTGTTAEMIFDTITFIPYDHYMSIENAVISVLYNEKIVTNELMDISAHAEAVTGAIFAEQSTIKEQNNFLYPVGALQVSGDRLVQLVYAARRADAQIAAHNLDNSAVTIFEAFEGYNG
jgi:hypothetical protein